MSPYGVRPSGSDTIAQLLRGARVSDPEGLTPLHMEKRAIFGGGCCPTCCSGRSSPSRSSSSTGRRARRCGSRSCCRTPSACARTSSGSRTTATCSRKATTTAPWPRRRSSPSPLARSRSRSRCMLAVQADKAIKGAGVYKTLLIWPYAVAPAVAGVLWLFMFQPSLGLVARGPALARGRLEPAAQRRPRHDARRPGVDVEADQLQFPVLPGRAAVDPANR